MSLTEEPSSLWVPLRRSATGLMLSLLLGCGGTTGTPSRDGGAGDGGDPGGISPGPGRGSLTGNLAFGVGSARTMVDYGTAPDGGLDFGRVEVAVTNRLDRVCARSPEMPAEVLTLYLIKSESERQAGATFGPGTHEVTPFTIGPSGMVSVVRARFDSTSDILGLASSGSVTLSTLHASGIAGSFSVVLRVRDGGTEALSGTFEAPACP